jgi:hypothetical protein
MQHKDELKYPYISLDVLIPKLFVKQSDVILVNIYSTWFYYPSFSSTAAALNTRIHFTVISVLLCIDNGRYVFAAVSTIGMKFLLLICVYISQLAQLVPSLGRTYSMLHLIRLLS